MSENKKINLKKLLNQPSLHYEKFHNLTTQSNLKPSPSAKNWPKEWKKIYFKGYSRLPEIQLPSPKLNSTSLKYALENRTSQRIFNKHPLTLTQLSNVFFYSAGIKNIHSTEDGSRFYPSAGSRYPIEIYFLSLNTQLHKGLYHYYVKSHALEKVLSLTKLNLHEYFVDDWVKKAAGILIFTAVFKRNTIKYGTRGYKQILIESGHLAQNMYLICSVLHMACCSLDGFSDEKMNKLLDIDGIDEAVIYTMALGN